jgi:hypothetical protein
MQNRFNALIARSNVTEGREVGLLCLCSVRCAAPKKIFLH